MIKPVAIAHAYKPDNVVTLYPGGCLDLLGAIGNGQMQLVVTSPPYNIGKEYEQRLCLDDYVLQQREVIAECVRITHPEGHICWQVGNYVDKGSIIPLDSLLFPVFQSLGLKMRNRIIWYFEHGLHCTRRFSRRHEMLN